MPKLESVISNFFWSFRPKPIDTNPTGSGLARSESRGIPRYLQRRLIDPYRSAFIHRMVPQRLKPSPNIPGSRLSTRRTTRASSFVIHQDKVFGPVLSVQTFKSEEEALRNANDVMYGLGSSIWTSDHGRAMRFSRDLDFGAVWVNEHGALAAEMPHGGFRHSGYGKDLSMYGFEDYTRIKHVMSYIGGYPI